MKVKSRGNDILFFIQLKRILCPYSDDELIYSKHSSNVLSSARHNNNDDWVLVEPGQDQRSKDLPDLKENVGPTFPVGASPSMATFYSEMLSDSLFDHIVMCTNTGARVYFDHILSSSESQDTWKPVDLLGCL